MLRRKNSPLVDLHLHIYGCIRSDSILSQLLEYEPYLDVAPYESSFHRAYGQHSPLRDILVRARSGHRDAREEFERLFVFGDADAGNFARFQAKFDLILAASAIGWVRGLAPPPGAVPLEKLRDEFQRFTAAIWSDFKEQGIDYAEIRFLVPTVEFLEFALAAFRRGADQGLNGPIFRVAPSLPRANPWPHWEKVTELALGENGEWITGVDFCFIEEGHPPREKAAFFDAVKDHNHKHPSRALSVLYHVGESFTDKSLESAVRWVHESAELGASRLGHAIALGIDPDAIGEHVRSESVAERRDQIRYDLSHAEGLERAGLRIDRAALDLELRTLDGVSGDQRIAHEYDEARLHEVRARQEYAMGCIRSIGTVIEVCPTSNRRIGGITDASHHPVHRFLKAGLRVVVASDDPGIFGTTLRDEIEWVRRTCNLSDDEVSALHDEAWRSRSEVLTGRET